MTFRERYMAGQADFEEIFDLTSQWNFSDEICTLREYLGLTAEEEDIWISISDEALEEFMEKEKKRKIFFTDLDDTLLNSQKEITPGNREAINRLLDQGHIMVISTGRALPSAIIQADRLGLNKKNCYIICFNGAQIYDIENQKLIYHESVPMDMVRFLFDEGKKYDITIQTYTDTHVVVEADNTDTRKYVSIQLLPYMVVDRVEDALEHEPAKVLALDYDDPEHLAKFRRHIEECCKGKLEIYLSHPSLLELLSPGVNKGNAARFLCRYLGIPIENSVSAGDAENDVSMIQAAHVGAAMCNGCQLVKDNADYITKADCNHDGVAEILNKFIL